MRLSYIVLWAGLHFFAPEKGEIIVQVKNIEAPKGCLRIALYNREEDFLREGNELVDKVAPVSLAESMQVAIPDLPFGKYAIAVYHDLNNNGKLDKNYLGIPTEPYAFSNNPKVKWRSPTFTETQVELNAAHKDLSVELKRWRKH
jgi:uncharacterized protein (DUF2141 family)